MGKFSKSMAAIFNNVQLTLAVVLDLRDDDELMKKQIRSSPSQTECVFCGRALEARAAGVHALLCHGGGLAHDPQVVP